MREFDTEEASYLLNELEETVSDLRAHILSPDADELTQNFKAFRNAQIKAVAAQLAADPPDLDDWDQEDWDQDDMTMDHAYERGFKVGHAQGFIQGQTANETEWSLEVGIPEQYIDTLTATIVDLNKERDDLLVTVGDKDAIIIGLNKRLSDYRTDTVRLHNYLSCRSSQAEAAHEDTLYSELQDEIEEVSRENAQLREDAPK